jgi:hypothetical protein
MSLLGLELSDAGIMVAGAEPAGLLKIDGGEFESPGYALPEKNRLTVGEDAARKAHLYPRQLLNRFWDRLNTEPLEQANPYAQNHAEIAYQHLAAIWTTAKNHGNETVIAVPSFFSRNCLGLILGIAGELSMPVKGFVPLSVAAASRQASEGLLLHLDIHLHRIELDCLKLKENLTQEHSISAEDSGLIRLHKEWVNGIGEEFVRTTRFDPFHQAVSEQELFDRLPIVLSQLQQTPTVIFEMKGGSKTYHVTLTRDHFLQKSEPVFRQIGRSIDRLREQYGVEDSGVTFQLTHRIAGLPGLTEMLSGIRDAKIIQLEPGAGALGILSFWDQIDNHDTGRGAPFLTSRPMPSQTVGHLPQPQDSAGPTHLLYRNIAYPLTEHPLFIGRKSAAEGSEICIQPHSAGSFQNHCSIQLRGEEVLLTDHSASGTFVDEHRITASATLELGQVIRLETRGERLQLIACLDTDET